jgi:hypothetical protein
MGQEQVPLQEIEPMSSFHSFSRLRVGLAGVLVAGGVLAGGMFHGRSGTPAEEPGSWDTSPQPAEPIKPGTVVGGEAPAGWSHLVIKSMPRPASGDVDRLSGRLSRLASLYFTALVADVRRQGEGDQASYQLARVGAGLGTRVKGEDRIISSGTWQEVGADLDWLATSALRRAEGKVEGMRLPVRSRLFALVDAPLLLLREGKHRPAVFRHALLVDPRTGKLDTLVWGIGCDEENHYGELLGDLHWLPPGHQEDCLLHADAREFGPLKMPREQVLALDHVHQGRRQLTPTREVRRLGALSRLTPEQAAELERRLRELLR